jgi:peptidoglycan/LPS O-acetylase OafA/YrhL
VLSFSAFQDRTYIAALDGLRAIAILMVLFHHVGRAPDDILNTLRENGRFGVGLFFVLSGFLISTLFLREERMCGRISLWKFYGRRAARLLPLYYAVLGVQCAAVWYTRFYSPESVALFNLKLASYLFYYSNWLPTATEGPFFFAWSLAVEEQFYVWFGLMMVFLPRRVLLAGVVSALALKFAVYQAFGAVDQLSPAWRVLFIYQEGLLFVVLLGFALNRKTLYDRMARFFSSAWAGISLALFIGSWAALHPVQGQSYWDGEVLVLAMAALTAAVVIRVRVPVLGSMWCAHVGRVSYGIYLFHWFVYVAVDRFLPRGHPTLFLLIAASFTIVLASLSYRYFETPIIRHFRRSSSRPFITPSSSTADLAPTTS